MRWDARAAAHNSRVHGGASVCALSFFRETLSAALRTQCNYCGYERSDAEFYAHLEQEHAGGGKEAA
jgi:hypothetical protein